MISIRRKLLFLSLVLLLSIGFAGVMPPAATEARDPIPAGCPGSTRDGPPAPARNPRGNIRTVCDEIPAGCPGSSHRGPERDESQCPYANVRDSAAQVQAQARSGSFRTGDNRYRTIRDVCGGTVNGSDNSVGVAINIGCQGKGNPIADMAFAVIRILTTLVGFVIIGSIIYGGIQFSGSRGDPQSTAMAINRIRSSLFALLLFIFGYAILNYLIPAGFLR